VRIKEYKTLIHEDPSNLDNRVNDLLSKGWQVYGSPSAQIIVDQNGYALWANYRQTMVFPVGPDIRDSVTIKEM